MQRTRHSLLVLAVFTQAVLMPALAHAADSVDAAKDAVRNIGQDGKALGSGLATTAKETGQAIGQGAKAVAQDVSKGFRRDFIEGGALKGGNRGLQPPPRAVDAQ